MLLFMAIEIEQIKKLEIQNKVLDSLIYKIAGGETEAMEEFYTLTKSSVYGFALSIVKNHELAEDIMQDTYIKIYGYANGYLSQNKPMAWILTIVRNLSITRIKHKSENSLTLEDAWVSIGEDFSESSLDKMILNKIMNLLSNEERQIIILKVVVGFKHREISEFLGLPLSTTLSKYYRTLSKLKNMLKEEAK